MKAYAVAGNGFNSTSTDGRYRGPGQPGWPVEVLKHLEIAPQGVGCRPAKGRKEQAPATTGLRLVSGACQIPHPDKADIGGDDSYFICPTGSGIGVADGVGEWEKLRVRPRYVAEEVMSGASATLERLARAGPERAIERALTALREAFDRTVSFGATTASVASLDAQGQMLGIANLGDSGLRQVRKADMCRGADGDSFSGSAWIVSRTREQQHFFNCPYQLSRLPQPSDFQRLRMQGLTELADAMTTGVPILQDMPEDAERYAFPLQEGDLLVMGTDGVFDNLHEREICEIVELTVSPLEARQVFAESASILRGPGSSTDPGALATTIAHAAFHRARDSSVVTPFAEHAQKQGINHIGGKMDDITVVCAWVVRTIIA